MNPYLVVPPKVKGGPQPWSSLLVLLLEPAGGGGSSASPQRLVRLMGMFQSHRALKPDTLSHNSVARALGDRWRRTLPGGPGL